MSQEPGDPYIHKPDMVEPPDDVLFCWRDPERVCSGECPAFDPRGADPANTQSTCILVNAAKQSSAALVNYVRMEQSHRVTQAPGTDMAPPGVRS